MGYSQERLAYKLGVERTTVARWESGENAPQPSIRPMIAQVLRMSLGEIECLFEQPDGQIILDDRSDFFPNGSAERGQLDIGSFAPLMGDEEVMDLSCRMAASDVGEPTLTHFEAAFDGLASAYPFTPPNELLLKVDRALACVGRLIDARKTLQEHRRLIVLGGWLSLLGATLKIDLKCSATAYLDTAMNLARQAEHYEIISWCFETSAWRLLTEGDYRKALELSQTAQRIAPKGSSAAVQAAAQEGRAWARLGQPTETYEAVNRVHGLVSPLTQPTVPEHHYRYDPAKSISYTATTLAWVNDPAAEEFARETIRRLGPTSDISKWPRRVASANVDLALTLLSSDRCDEAVDLTEAAIASGRIVPSNYWRVKEVVMEAESRRFSKAKELKDSYETMVRGG